MEYNEFDTELASKQGREAAIAAQGKQPVPQWLKYLWSGIIGFAIGAGIVMALATTVLRDAQKIASDLADEKLKLYSSGTILYEDVVSCHEDGAGIPVLNGLATIHINGMAVQAPNSRFVPRWYIPMNVEPVGIGQGLGVSVAVTHFPIRNPNVVGITTDQLK
jgi:hypothetical protein